MRYLKASIFTIFLWVSLSWGQFAIPEKPQHQTGVYDYVNVLSAAQYNALEQKLLRYADSTSTQMVIAIIASTEGENINFLGAQWGQQWGIGQADKDNGILILLAKDDRKIAINTGYGVEGTLTDLMSKRIIESIIIPEFKKGNYYGGLDKGVDAIVQVLRGEFTAKHSRGNPEISLKALWPFLLFIIILIILFRKGKNNGGKNGQRGRGPDLWDVILLSSLGRSSGSSGGWGGGGFGSGGFGGGGFGGGGASGGW